MDNHDIFAQRLARINGKTCQHLYVGVDESYQVPLTDTPRRGRGRGAGRRAAPMGLIFAFVLGAVAVLLGSYALLKAGLMPFGGLDPQTALLGHLSVAVIVGFVLSETFRLSRTSYALARLTGIVAMQGTLHHIVLIQPEFFAEIYAPEWVAEILHQSAAATIYFPGLPFFL